MAIQNSSFDPLCSHYYYYGRGMIQASRKASDYIDRYVHEIMVSMDRHTGEVFIFEVSNRLLR
jgi:hypothetical protein